SAAAYDPATADGGTAGTCARAAAAQQSHELRGRARCADRGNRPADRNRRVLREHARTAGARFATATVRRIADELLQPCVCDRNRVNRGGAAFPVLLVDIPPALRSTGGQLSRPHGTVAAAELLKGNEGRGAVAVMTYRGHEGAQERASP